MVVFFIIHPRVSYDPPVDRDFALCFQNFFIPPNSTIPDTQRMDWNWHTINGRSGPYTPPLVCKHGERVRIRILDFSPMQHHPVHIHGHTFWGDGNGGREDPEKRLAAWEQRAGGSRRRPRHRVRFIQRRRLADALPHDEPHGSQVGPQ